jgi:hypothetical protein
MNTTTRGLRGIALVNALIASICISAVDPGIARAAADFQVSGVFTFNGTDSTLSGTFGPSAYSNASGVLTAGAFNFPSAMLQFGPGGDAQYTVHYQLVQTNTSNGQVAGDGVAAMTNSTMKLHVIDAHTPAILWDVGSNCDFGPFNVLPAGMGTGSGLDLHASGITILPLDASACGGHGAQLSTGIAGTDNRTQLLLAGDFSPPPDKIFSDSFD